MLQGDAAEKEGIMPIQYKINVLEALKSAGYSTYRIRKEKIMGESVLQKLRRKEYLSEKELNIICELLNLQPGDIFEHMPDN